jgi:hypothetical protein
VIEEFIMIRLRLLAAISAASVVMAMPLLGAHEASPRPAHDLSKYREFHLGMSLITVAQRADITAEARVIHRRPELIQDLMWLPAPSRVPGASTQGDSARQLLFSFYNDQLFRIVVTYDRERTEGLTADDVIEAISATYGIPMLPVTGNRPSSAPAAKATDKLLAHWEDSNASLSLFQSSYLSAFGLVVLSKRLDTLARVAAVEAILLDEQEAPQREIERQQNQTAESRVKQQTARRVNKATFRP